MFGNHFYHETIKRSVSVFGTLFNNINIKRDNGTIIKVPLAYGQRQKFIARLQQQAGLGLDGVPRTAVSLPRMAFELTSIDYDPTRKLNKKVHFKKEKSTDPTVMMKQFSPAPYNLGFDLHALVKNTDDGLQIIEQIMPFFTPDYTVTINTVPSIGDKRDVPIILTGVTQNDEYEGDFETRRVLSYTLNFTMKNYLFGPVEEPEIIRKVNVRTYMEKGTGEITSEDTAGKTSEIIVEPNPSDADPDSTFTYNETTNFFEQPTVTYSDDKSSDPK